jgi:dolichol-phosphate mannosyltransferase
MQQTTEQTQNVQTARIGSDVSIELSVIVPTYNEAGNVPELLRRIGRVVTERSIPCEVLVMDDASPDGTADVARTTQVAVPVRVVERTGPKGLSPAVIEGIGLARGKYVLVMDADLQHPPESLVDLLEAAKAGADFVIGSRYVEGGESNEFGFYRRINSKAATWMSAPLVGSKVRDPMAGFFCFRRELADTAELTAIGYKIGLELIVKCKPATVREVPIRFGSRHAGDSKMDLGQQWEYVKHLRRLYQWKFPVWSQCAVFCLVGLSGMVVDLGTMAMLIGGQVAFPAARALSIMAAMFWNFLLNRRFTFPEAAQGNCERQLFKFVGVCSLGLVINWTVSNLLYISLPALQGWYQISCIGGIIAGTANNFLLSKHFAFRVPAGGTGKT